MSKSSATEENKEMNKFDKMTEGKFFSFSRPYLNNISNGKIFSLIYFVMACINPVIPFLVLYKVIDAGLFSFDAKYVFAFILTWFVIFFACWIGLQIWLERRKNIINVGASEFVAIIFSSELLKTFGEWAGSLIGIIGFGGGLLSSIFLGNDVNNLFRAIGMGYMERGVMIIVVAPVLGFFIILTSHLIAEQLRLWAALASNTKEIAVNIKDHK